MFAATTSREYSMVEYPPIRPFHVESSPRWKSTKPELAPNCPRCASPNTKFCYYNNYSLSQPRYFCKGCRRYWTKGGSLRNVPVGGGCRKARRARGMAARDGAGLAGSARPVSAPGNHESIDLAAVFAKYVSKSSTHLEINPEDSSSDQASSGGDLECQIEDFDPINGQLPEAEFVGGVYDQFQHDIIPQLDSTVYGSDVDFQDFVCQSSDNLGILDQSVLPVDLSWSDDVNLTDFESQQPTTVEIEDLGIFSGDDQLRISASSSLHDNWGSFDQIPGYEIFSRP